MSVQVSHFDPFHPTIYQNYTRTTPRIKDKIGLLGKTLEKTEKSWDGGRYAVARRDYADLAGEEKDGSMFGAAGLVG